jgi:hypothetical protein
MFGGIATLCPECSHQWTLSPVVSISWPCPRCGGSRCTQADQNVCKCSHTYAQHNTTARLKPSRAAFGIHIGELDKLDELLATEPEPPPKLGDCTACSCECFELDPPLLSATQFLRALDCASPRGSGGRQVKAVQMADGTLCISNSERSVSLRAESEDRVVVEARPASDAVPRILTMGQDSVGHTVIAIRRALRTEPSEQV